MNQQAQRLESKPFPRSCDRVAEGAPLLREYVGKTCIEGSNPSGSAKIFCSNARSAA
jgi:hypothetical protein